MTAEHQPDVIKMIEARKKSIEAEEEDSVKAEIVTEGELSLLDGQKDLLIVLSELLSNCLEEEGVTTIRIMIEKGRLKIEDDVVHDNAGAIVLKLNSRGFVKTTKDGHYGTGVWGSRYLLKQHDGKLKYLTEGGRIIAVATWVE